MSPTKTKKTAWRRLALEGTRVYLSKLDPSLSHSHNVDNVLRGIVLQLTLKAQGHQQQDAGEHQADYEWNEGTLNKLDHAGRARLQGLIKSIELAVPSNDPIITTRRRREKKKDPIEKLPPSPIHSMEDPISTSSTGSTSSGPILSSIQDAVRRSPLSLRSPPTSIVQFKSYPQIRASVLALRLELYFKACCGVDTGNNNDLVRVQATCLVRSFCATVDSCVASVSPLLMGLLQALTMEVLCVEEFGLKNGKLQTMMKRIVSEYERQVSFASLAFLSSPQDSAEHVLQPLVASYLSFLLQNNLELQDTCRTETWLAQVLPTRLRRVFHTVEFQSVKHLLEVCRSFQYELSHIDIPPAAGDIVNSKEEYDKKATQALMDLQRESLSINGQVLPPITSRDQLVKLLTSTLNQTVTQQFVLRDDDEENCMSSSLDTRTLDAMTRRLLVATSRTGSAGDAYFVVRDLFGGEDAEVVPSVNLKKGIELKACLSSITITCYSSFQVYPKDLVRQVEPLIELHAATTERIYLQEVRQDGELVLQEKLGNPRQGLKTLSIRPAVHEIP